MTYFELICFICGILTPLVGALTVGIVQIRKERTKERDIYSGVTIGEFADNGNR